MQTTTTSTATGTSTGTISQGTVSTFTTPTDTTTSTHLHGTVFTSTSPTGSTTSIDRSLQFIPTWSFIVFYWPRKCYDVYSSKLRILDASVMLLLDLQTISLIQIFVTYQAPASLFHKIKVQRTLPLGFLKLDREHPNICRTITPEIIESTE